MMEARLSMGTCDKCGKPMERDDRVVVVADGWIRGPRHEGLITFWAQCISYACHEKCWDGPSEAGDGVGREARCQTTG